MNPAAQRRLAGFNVLLASNGETLTFRGGPLQAIVNRRPERKGMPNTPDFEDRAASAIEFLSSAIAEPPAAGEAFLDEFDVSHRISKVPRQTDITFRVDCVSTQTEASQS